MKETGMGKRVSGKAAIWFAIHFVKVKQYPSKQNLIQDYRNTLKRL